MHSNLRERARSEGGFTLIELLVVMIIIAILMAVAVPTFLAQKNNAQKSKATANIKQIVNAIEACAANNTTGAYNQVGVGAAASGSDCTTWGNLTTAEKALRNLPNGTGLNQYSVVPSSANGQGAQGYMVSTSIKDGNTNVWFAEIHFEDGSLYKRCGSGASAPAVTLTGTAPAKTTIGAAVANSRTCTSGDWG